MDYPWFVAVEASDTLQQGDIIERCNVILPTEECYIAIATNKEPQKPAEIIIINGIVLSQSCDIVNDKIDSIILCPLISLGDLPIYQNPKLREELRQGKSPAHHLLAKCKIADLPEDYYVADFHHIYSLPKNFLVQMLAGKKRKRLLPPYREHLSQSFARYFMRVGLPSDIPADEIKSYSAPVHIVV